MSVGRHDGRSGPVSDLLDREMRDLTERLVVLETDMDGMYTVFLEDAADGRVEDGELSKFKSEFVRLARVGTAASYDQMDVSRR